VRHMRRSEPGAQQRARRARSAARLQTPRTALPQVACGWRTLQARQAVEVLLRSLRPAVRVVSVRAGGQARVLLTAAPAASAQLAYPPRGAFVEGGKRRGARACCLPPRSFLRCPLAEQPHAPLPAHSAESITSVNSPALRELAAGPAAPAAWHSTRSGKSRAGDRRHAQRVGAQVSAHSARATRADMSASRTVPRLVATAGFALLCYATYTTIQCALGAAAATRVLHRSDAARAHADKHQLQVAGSEFEWPQAEARVLRCLRVRVCVLHTRVVTHSRATAAADCCCAVYARAGAAGPGGWDVAVFSWCARC
jgi:hypothetical protein